MWIRKDIVYFRRVKVFQGNVYVARRCVGRFLCLKIYNKRRFTSCPAMETPASPGMDFDSGRWTPFFLFTRHKTF